MSEESIPRQNPLDASRPDEAATIPPRTSPRAFPRPARPDEAETVAPREAPPLVARRYRVLRQLGQGGMGSVWLAEDLKLEHRQVALKMLPAFLAGKPAFYRQVRDEALMAMKLSHPNIATVRAFEEDEGGNPFLVMDYVEGRALDDILAGKGALSEAEAQAFLSPVAAALDYAHAQGVVHRDVKPGNVIVRTDGTPFVLDFGIAREVQETVTRVTGKTSGGTLLYMSPEQLNGRAPKAAQDVYSFAAMAYECLTGRPPFSRGQIEWQILHNDPEPLPETVSAGLRRGIMAGLAKEPQDRPGSCAAVLSGAATAPRPAPVAAATPPPKPASAPPPAATSGQAPAAKLDSQAFLHRVRLEKALSEKGIRSVKPTAAELAELESVRNYFAAGNQALQLGRESEAVALFAEADAALSDWNRRVAERKEANKQRLDRECQLRLEEATRWWMGADQFWLLIGWGFGMFAGAANIIGASVGAGPVLGSLLLGCAELAGARWAARKWSTSEKLWVSILRGVLCLLLLGILDVVMLPPPNQVNTMFATIPFVTGICWISWTLRTRLRGIASRKWCRHLLALVTASAIFFVFGDICHDYGWMLRWNMENRQFIDDVTFP